MVITLSCGDKSEYKPVQREIDEVLLEVSRLLAVEELGGRRRKVYYRNRVERTREDRDLGIPGSPIQGWTLIQPTPSVSDVDREFAIKSQGVLEVGDMEMRVDRLAVSRETLSLAEFYIDDNPDADPPFVNTPANYDVIGGSVQEGGSGIRGRYVSSWVCTLRKRQSNARNS